MKSAFCIQILGGVALGSLAISILFLNLRSLDFCFNVQKTNWTAVSKRYQRIIVTVAVIETFVIQLWSLLLMLTLFDKKDQSNYTESFGRIIRHLFQAVLSDVRR